MADTPLQLDSLALLAIPSCWLCPLPPPRRETWEQNVVFSFGLTFWTSVQQVLVQSYESLLIFGDLHGRFHILCLSSCSRTLLDGLQSLLYCVMSHLLIVYSSLGRVWLLPNSW